MVATFSYKTIDKLMLAVATGIDTDYLAEASIRAFFGVLACCMRIAEESEKADCLTGVLNKNCVTAVSNKEERALTVYWIKGNALGSLTVREPDTSSSVKHEITGRFRSLSMLRELELKADTKPNDIGKRMEVWPGVTVHWRDGTDSFDISAIGLTVPSARDRVADFIARLQEVIAQGIDRKSARAEAD